MRILAAGLLSAVLALVHASATAAVQADETIVDGLKKLSLEELMAVDVSTASRLAEPLFETPAAVHVITRDEIRRSGVRSIAEALRLAPGVEVAQENSHSWNITLRGSNGDLSNKLLVLIDGRSVYSPLFAGVFWDVQDYPVGDIERIEVVGGPGGALWGANAVNGVINIITRSAKDSPGVAFGGGGGDEERVFGGVRFGGELGNDWHGRGYLKYFERDGSALAAGGSGIDEWNMAQAGFRLDRDAAGDSFTFQGDVYEGSERARFNRDFTLGTLPTGVFEGDIDLAGANLLGRWSRRSGAGSEMALKIYLDRTERRIPSTFAEERNTFDVDFQNRVEPGPRQDLLWGLGVRYTEDSIDNTIFATFQPASRGDWTVSAFVQDRIDLWQERLFLTVGSKIEHNDYSGAELQPSVRLSAQVSERQMLWSAVSRAVRIPSRLDADIRLTAPLSIPGIPIPLYVLVDGSEDFDSEELWAYEAGWRAEPSPNVTLDLSVYHHEYQDLQTQEPLQPVLVTDPLPYILLPNVLANGKDAQADGATFGATWQPHEKWRLKLNYSYFDMSVDPHADSLDPSASRVEGNSPRHQASLQTYVDLPHRISVYGGLRFVDDLPNQGVADYMAFDANVIWRATDNLEFAVSGRNLFDPGHPEFGGGGTEIERSWYARIAWRY